ncbi:MAG: trypsin-like serine protease [Oscillospiraceae bacterium]|jgi:serine protease Do|nr:trypsin-like serine protease [Oscillospiraceae bacterium]
MEMEDIRIEETTEIILTYRQPEAAKPVVLRYERELPESMRPALPPEEDPGWTGPPRRSAPPPWQAAIAPPEKQKKSHWGVRLYVGVSLAVILVCLGVGLWYFTQNGFGIPARTPDRDAIPPREDGYFYYGDELEDKTITIPSYPTGGDARLRLLPAEDLPELTAKEIYDQVTPSVVTVLGRPQTYNSMYSVGTGVIFSSDGYILTNCHVIAGCGACQVWITNAYGVDAEYDAKVVGYDEDVDLAVLKIEGGQLPSAAFGVSDDLEVGDPVYAIGNPLGVKLRNTLTSGIISATDRDVDVDGVVMTLVQTTAALNSGNSGGPLINQYGQVIGINTIKMMSDYDTIEGLGFAIPSSLAIRWVNELVEFGELQPQPVLGVSIAKIPEMLPDGTLGLRVESVTPELTGDLAGVLEGDYVLAFNGQTVTSVQQILSIRRDLHVGDEVPVRIFRDGEYLEIIMTMMAE